MAENGKTKARESLSSDPEVGYFSLSRTLSSEEVDPPHPVLHVDPSEAFLLTGCADFFSGSASGSHSQQCLLVLDGLGGVYKLLLASCARDRYTISQDWKELVSDHNLKPGDEIFFKRQKIKAMLECYYYDFTFHRKATLEIEFRTLSAFEAARHGAKPKHFLDFPLGTFSENLVVFDADKKSHDAFSSRPKRDDGKMINTVDSGFMRFARVQTDDEVRHSYRPYYNVRVMPDEEATCFSKTISEFEVVRDGKNPSL